MENRVTLVDVVRGFALLGVVVSNVAVVWGSGASAVEPSALDIRVGTLVAYLITGKFLALFALLFGVSFGLYLRRAHATGRPAIARHLRRMAILLLFGVANRVLFGPDVLMNYAVLGATLVLFRHAPDRVLLIAALIALGIPELWQAASGWIGYTPAPSPLSRAERLRLATEGPWLDLVWWRVGRLTVWANEFLRTGYYLALFLVGMWAAGRELFERPDEHQRTWKLLWWGGLALSLGGYAAQAALRPGLANVPWMGTAFGVVWPLTTFIGGISYGAGIVLLWMLGGRIRNVLALMAPAGRMTLTNYIAASGIITIVAAATRTYGAVGAGVASGVGLLLWTAEVAWSRWWLARHHLGPLEWLWRRGSAT